MKKLLSILLILALTATFAACGSGPGTSSAGPSSSMSESSESIPPQVSSVVVESEVDPHTAEINSLLQSGLWSYDVPGSIFAYLNFSSVENPDYDGLWGSHFYLGIPITTPNHPANIVFDYYNIVNNTIILYFTLGQTTAGSQATLELSTEGTAPTLTVQSGDSIYSDYNMAPGTVYTLQPYPTDVDYFDTTTHLMRYGVSQSKPMYEFGLRVYTAPNRDAETIPFQIDANPRPPSSQIYLCGTWKSDPEWYFVIFRGTIGYSHSDDLIIPEDMELEYK